MNASDIYIYISLYIYIYYTATYQPLRKLSKLEEPDMQNTTGEVEMNY